MASSTRTRISSADSTMAPATGVVRRRAELASSAAPKSRDLEPRAASWGVREVLDIRQASEYLGISPDSLYKYASEGFIPAFKLGNRWRFKRSLLERWMEQQSSLPMSPASGKNVKPRQKKPVSRVR